MRAAPMNAPLIYQPKTAPYAHQAQAFARFKDAGIFMLAMEQRTGKTKVVLDIAAYQFEQQNITALLIVAMPGRVHANWAKNEIPAHLPDRIKRMTFVWDAGKVRTKKIEAELDALLKFPGLSILAVNGEATITPAFRAYATKFLKARKRVMVAADEFTLIMKTPGAKRTKLMLAIGRQPEVKIKTILDGTPVGEGPLDLYAPVAFLSPSIFGFSNFHTFKHHFAKWEKKTIWDKKTSKSRDYEDLTEYQNLDELTKKLAPISFRILRKDCWDVPAKVYQTHSFQLSPIQRKVYDALAEEYKAKLQDGHEVSTTHVLTRYLRLQQIASGFWPAEDVTAIHPPCNGEGCEGCEDLGVTITRTKLRPIDPTRNSRKEALSELLSLNPGPGIVWARFHEDVDQAMAAATAAGRRPIQYDGRIGPAAKDAALAAYQNPLSPPDILVGNPRSGGRGLRLDRAEWMIYYSNDFSLLSRLQSEDRAEAKDKPTGTGIIDLLAEDTIDQTIVDALRSKKSIVDHVMQEKNGKWL
jgi:hypothetical protein